MTMLAGLRRRGIASHAALVSAAAIVVVPVVWVIAAGFRTQISLLMGAFWFSPILANFHEVLFSATSDFLVNYRNSLVVGMTSTALCLVVATLAAWSLHRMRWPRWVVHVFLGWALVFQMIPPIALAGAWFTMARAVGLDSTLLSLVLAHTVLNLPMALWLMGVYRARRAGGTGGSGAARWRLHAHAAVAHRACRSSRRVSRLPRC